VKYLLEIGPGPLQKQPVVGNIMACARRVASISAEEQKSAVIYDKDINFHRQSRFYPFLS
jgi:hypothetical protein